MLRKTDHGPLGSNGLSTPLRSVQEGVLTGTELGTPVAGRPAPQVLWNCLPLGEGGML